MSERRLEVLRKKIDRLDKQIVDLLNTRAQVALEVGQLKKRDGTAYYAPNRERRILERLSQKNPGPFPTHALQSVYQEIFSASRSLQAPLKVGFLGPQATFTHLAALKQFGNSAELVPLPSIAKVFDEVEHHRVEYGIVPIENSNEGIVNATLDAFADSFLKISGEIVIPIHHHLMGHGTGLTGIKRIYSHPQATGQCRRWLEENLPDVSIVDADSTAAAAQKAALDRNAAAIASEYAAQVYQLKVLRRHIEDHANNWTRFLIVTTETSPPTGNDKTSLLFSVKDVPGILYKTLEPFARLRINMTKINSRPIKKRAWEYLFFIDLDGHMADKRLKTAVASLQAHCRDLKVLGSYPKWA